MQLKGRYAHSRPFVKVLQWMAAVVCLTLLSVLLINLLQSLTGWSSADMAYLKTVQALQTVSVFLLPPLLLAYVWSDKPWQWLHLAKVRPVDSLVQKKITAVWWLVPISIVSAMPAINLLVYINEQISLPAFLAPMEAWMQQMEENAAVLTERFLQVDNGWGLLLNLFVMALLPALGEELTFRGLLLNGLNRHQQPHLAIWVVAVLFSAMHMQFYGFIPRMLLGAYFGYLVVWSGSLWLPVLAHLTNNAMAVIGNYVVFKTQSDTQWLESFGTGDTLWVGIVSLLVSLFMIAIISRLMNKRCC